MLGTLTQTFVKLTLNSQFLVKSSFTPIIEQVRHFPKTPLIDKCYRRVVFFPEKYTTTPLRIRKLGGRDPVTGRVVVGKIGGGAKQKYRWVLTQRKPKEDGPLYERVLQVRYDPIRTADIALVAHDDKKRWIIATENMKAGDIIKTSGEMPRIPIRGKEGDAYPLGALPIGTLVCGVEPYPGFGGFFARAAGTKCQILRKVANNVIVQLPSKREISVKKECMAVIGRVSNINHADTPIGSPNRLRWLGNRPCSGWWQRKDGYCGRKIRPMKPLRVYDRPSPPEEPEYILTRV